jgi:hypothetical protein
MNNMSKKRNMENPKGSSGKKSKQPYVENDFQGDDSIQKFWKQKELEESKIKVLIKNGKTIPV